MALDLEKIDPGKLSDYELSLLILRRNVRQYEVEQIDELLNRVGEAKALEDSTAINVPGQQNKFATVAEKTFAILKFEEQQGAKIGAYEVAYEPNNIPDKFNHAYNILRNSNATIRHRYTRTEYVFSYWLYGKGKIYRQSLKTKKT